MVKFCWRRIWLAVKIVVPLLFVAVLINVTRPDRSPIDHARLDAADPGLSNLATATNNGIALTFVPMRPGPELSPQQIRKHREAAQRLADHLTHINFYKKTTKTHREEADTVPIAASQLLDTSNRRSVTQSVDGKNMAAQQADVLPIEQGTRPTLSIVNVPETSASTMITYVRLLLGCKPCSCGNQRQCLQECPNLLNQCGHSPYPTSRTLLDNMARNKTFVMTVLRAPAQRLARTYHQAKKQMHPRYGCCGLPRSMVSVFKEDPRVSLYDFALRPGVRNAMTRMLAGHSSADPSLEVTPAVFSKAVRNLEGMVFFGIAECLEESLVLLRHTLVTIGLLPAAGSPKLLLQQVAVAMQSEGYQGHGLAPNATETERLEQVEDYDTKLYKTAVELMRQRMKRIGGNFCQVSSNPGKKGTGHSN